MRRLLGLFLILGLFVAFAAPLLLVDANPTPGGFIWPIDIPAPASVHLTTRVAAPVESASYSNGSIKICFNNTIDAPNSIDTYVNIVCIYQGDWMQDSKWSPFPPDADIGSQTIDFLQYNFTITGIPQGNHRLNITAYG